MYEYGVSKPLVKMKEGGKGKVTLEKKKGIITSKDIEEIKDAIKTLPKLKISLKELDEIYYEDICSIQ